MKIQLRQPTQPIPCECGCLRAGHPNKMTIVEAIEHKRSDQAHLQKPMHRWRVLRECEGPFKREMEMMDALRSLTMALEQRQIRFRLGRWSYVWKSFLFRLPSAPDVYNALVEIKRRTMGDADARKLARRQTIVCCAPEWISIRLAARWTGRRV